MGNGQPRDAAERDILLVGSVPLDNAASVFETVAGGLGDRLRALPDGETGARTNWIAWQRAVLADNPALVELPSDTPFPQFGVAEGAAEVRFDDLGYADAALASWEEFRRLKENGRIPPGLKFQVSLPTPLAVIAQYLVPEAQAAVEPAYRDRLMAELRHILDRVEHDQLAIQWDVAVEFAVLEGLRPVHFAEPRQGIVDRLTEAIGAVPTDVALGLHFCYGDSGHKHFKEPEDTALMVDIANAVTARPPRPVGWIHMPVPRDRDDEAYFAPLADLDLPADTDLFLGLVHHSDGIEGARRRMESARRFAGDFGVATECGWGRRTADQVPDLMRLHREAADL